MKADIEEVKSKVSSIKAEDKKSVYVEISESPDIMQLGKIHL